MSWAPAFLGKELHDDVKWRILTDGQWFYVECKGPEDKEWQGGLSGTKEFLGLTEEEALRAYPKKKK